MPNFSEKKMAIKSVPPLVAWAYRQREMAQAFKMPPNTAASSQNDHKTGIAGKFFPYKFETDKDRNSIQGKID